MRTACLAVLFTAAASHVVPSGQSASIALSGRWSGTSHHGRTKVTYVFEPNGIATWFVDSNGFKSDFPNGLRCKYSISATKPLSQIDFTELDHPRFDNVEVRGVIEIIDLKTLRMDIRPGKPGKRPRAFTQEAVTFRAE